MNAQALMSFLQGQYQGLPMWAWAGLALAGLMILYRVYVVYRRMSFLLRLVLALAGFGTYGGVSSCTHNLRSPVVGQAPVNQGAGAQATGGSASGGGAGTSLWP
jgi:hypothetical protein